MNSILSMYLIFFFVMHTYRCSFSELWISQEIIAKAAGLRIAEGKKHIDEYVIILEDEESVLQKIDKLRDTAKNAIESFDGANKNLNISFHILGRIYENSLYFEAQADQQLRWEEYSKSIIEVSLKSTKNETTKNKPARFSEIK